MFSEFDEKCMALALSEAKKGMGSSYPNPCVGAVVVRNGKILATGYHVRAGEDHAEISVFRKLGWSGSFSKTFKTSKLRGATLYVTLEPCAFPGRTPPCVSAIIDGQIARVVFALRDPHDMGGKGVAMMRRAGICVESGLLKEESRMLLQFFLKNVQKKLPYVTAKVAMTLDGKIATLSGKSRGITGAESLRRVHLLRAQNQSILVGVGTVLIDNPHLGVRYVPRVEGHDPLRVILDSQLKSPLSADVFRDSNVVVFTTDRARSSQIKAFEKKQIRVISLGSDIFPQKVLKYLFSEGISTVLVEGGAHIFTSFWESNCIDRFITFIAPKFMAEEKALSPLLGRRISKISDLDVLKNVRIETVGVDVMIDGYLKIY